ncbi:alpha-L-arabinofuranosidase C-terminal domain-containing protein [uncultured Parabacteroides sp.]|uniref:alpha-L-arabinofuranosidase C-terminal domain-containing protein n=1 Tax=uncultured Parabacteroides sp. TaxID=512312 RepID=UPI00258710D8|nr:alpha-L-arabinofuranosidase C-terminal domain-containing protein [uncultured Parabacteroides sp.]
MMKKIKRIITSFLILSACFSGPSFAKAGDLASKPDSAYLFSYATDKDNNHNGLHFAWSTDKKNWHRIGPEHSFLRCDYGRWGTEKRMLSPYLIRTSDGLWHCFWTLNESTQTFGHAASADLVTWGRQSYSTTTDDLSTYNPSTPAAYPQDGRCTVVLYDKPETGVIHKVPWEVVDKLIAAKDMVAYKDRIYSETTQEDPVRFASLKPFNTTVIVNGNQKKPISDLLVGAFFEDINYAADGGLYAELIQNRDFEYSPADKEGNDPAWNSKKSWTLKGANASFTIDSTQPIHPNNLHYAVLKTDQPGAALVNEGFDGITLKAGDKYKFSLFARTLDGKNGKLQVRLTGKDGRIYAEGFTGGLSREWKKLPVTLTARENVSDAQLEVVTRTPGTIALDMISLFPEKTFMNRPNGLRADLAQAIADIHPRFIRFPGGCVAHGDGLDNMYRWKNTIGPLEARKPQRNLWGYHQTAGLGYFEYFRFCEDIGAEPVPVVAAGVPCQNSACTHRGGGQQGGIPMCEMDDYVQEILDLIEYANGDVKTEWGKKRAEAGHPKPFNLKYIGIGNEDLITDIFEERFTMLFNAVKEKHPEITVIGTVGPYSEGTDYEEGWELANKLNIPMVDEHYYQKPGWFIHNQDYYDKYDRSKSKVYLGEYAAHLPGRPNNLETALSEALYMTALERNGDVVHMTSYAPLLAKEGHTQWNPDLIYFNNEEVKPTVGYYVQQLYGQHAGDEYLNSRVILPEENDAMQKRIASSVVRDSRSNDLIVKLVNLLPVPTQTSVLLKDIPVVEETATLTTLSGKPDDKQAKPVTTTIRVSNDFDIDLPAYSFTVIRIKQNNINLKSK